MRIAMIGRDLPRPRSSGGVSGQIHLLAGELARSGHHVTVFALNRPPTETGYHFERIPLPGVIQRHRRVGLYLTPWWAGHIGLNEFDVVHAHGEDQCITTRRPVVRTFYGAERAEARFSTSLRHWLYHLSMVPFEWVSERRASAVVAISRSTQQYLGRPATVIPCGYEPTLFYPAGERSAQPTILFVGDLGTRKRAELLLHVFAEEVLRAIPVAELWMVTSKGIEARGVRCFGRVSQADLAALYRKAWLYCMPSSYEGFGVPYLEAMASGTPVVATPNGGAEELLVDGRAGCLTSADNLGGALIRVLSDSGLRQSLAEKGLARAADFRIARIAAQYVALYSQLIEKRPEIA